MIVALLHIVGICLSTALSSRSWKKAALEPPGHIPDVINPKELETDCSLSNQSQLYYNSTIVF